MRLPRKPRKFAGFSGIVDSGDAKAPMLLEHLLTRNGKLTTQVPRTNAHPRTESMRPEVDPWQSRRVFAVNFPRSILFGLRLSFSRVLGLPLFQLQPVPQRFDELGVI